jgi:DNA polymerase-3 subunit alpha
MNQSPIIEGITAQHLKFFGLIKFDILGLTTLKIIRRCIENILIYDKGIENPSMDQVWEFYNEHLHPDVIDFGDKKVFKNIKAGKFPSIFQFSERNMQNFCKRAKPNHMMDVSALSALWRPGPLKGMADKRYLASRDSDVKKEHLIIQDILGETRGILLYQEQFMMLAHKLAGFSLEGADKLRKLLVKPATSLAEEMKKERIEVGKRFIQGCVEKGLSPQRAKALWEKEILGFISYGFNKSHSVSYAINSHHCAWLFAYYPKHWIKACLECDPDLEKTINVVRALGFLIRKPDVNLSEADDWNMLEDGSCIPALTSLKDVGITASEELARRRPDGGFKNVQDFFYEDGSWRWSKFNKRSLRSMMRMEAFDALDCVGEGKLFKNYKHMEDSLFNNWDLLRGMRKKVMSLKEAAFATPDDDWTAVEKMTNQKEIIGFYDKNLLIGEYKEVLEEFKIKAIDEVPDNKAKKRVWAVVEKVEQRTTVNRKPFLVVTVSGMSEVFYMFRVWDTSMAKTEYWKEGYVLVFNLSHSKEWGYNVPRGCEVIRLTK